MDSEWSLRFVNRCDGVSEERCLAGYGFSVRSTGDFELGPGPAGEVLKGSVTSQELMSLSETLAREFRSPSECGKRSDTDSGVFLNSIPFCQNDRSLHDALYLLAERYSPSAFPNPCIDASISLDAVYAVMRRCDEDTDCAVAGEDFLPLRNDAGDEIESDDCTYLHPMLVGNSFLMVTNQLELLMKRDLAKKVCGQELMRASCRQDRWIDVGQRAPSCVDGICTLGGLIK
jgi:hypothetical protein